MLAVKAVFDVLIDIDLVNDLICIVLQGSCEYDYLIELSHELDKVHTTWSH